ncbi:FKBP-type peptidyl-prolyl cis-trans isomerase [Flavobacteriaceae bacterium LSUCC0859]|nr:FKBP-type peptidyl-prolyl cis-trans isomerase [Flavobacteriaceae bacterium LSUCC0859]
MKYFYVFLVCLTLLNCSRNSDSKDPELVAIENEAQIIAYLEDNNLQATKSSSGLYYRIDSQGNGSYPNRTDRVKVAYKGYYINGKVFDQSNSSGISFSLTQVIPGWTEGITYFRAGGKGQLFIPASLGYGLNDYNGIPGGSVLIFDINLIEVQN